MIAGAIAGSATVLITNPIWVVNTRMTARKNESDLPSISDAEKERERKRKAASTVGTTMKIIREEGFMQLFAGVLPALVLVINPILQYTIFEQLKNVLERRKRVTPTDSFYLGAFGKLMATGITYPYITVKSRMHVATKDSRKEDMFSSFSRIWKEEGWSGLYGGESTPAHFIFPLKCSIIGCLFSDSVVFSQVCERSWYRTFYVLLKTRICAVQSFVKKYLVFMVLWMQSAH